MHVRHAVTMIVLWFFHQFALHLSSLWFKMRITPSRRKDRASERRSE
uniref:TLC domain-containing protein n=1 Tax=Ascaris lumbricoides TaxID=6252 RepID=A0A0M3I0K0_ASCLU